MEFNGSKSKEFNEDNEKGLTDTEVSAKISQFGYNEIKKEKSRTPIQGILKRLWGPVPGILEFAIVFQIILGKYLEAIIILILLLFSVIVGETQERRSKKALEYLIANLQVISKVKRNAKWMLVPAREIVPDDLIRIQTGDLIPADCVIRSGSVEVDQAMITGESTNISRTNDELVYSGSIVKHGNAICSVKATGINSFYGKTAELVKTARSPSHLEKLLFTVIRYLATIDAILSGILFIAAIIFKANIIEIIPFLLVLIIVTIPVSMPASFTVANALEARRLAKDGVLVTGLTAVQEAASMEVLCVDKTGTLTENRQSIAFLSPSENVTENELLTIARVACDELNQSPIDQAIMEEFTRRNLTPINRLSFTPFDPTLKRSEATFLREGESYRVVMGAPLIIETFAAHSSDFQKRIDDLLKNGARILAVAGGTKNNLSVLGFIGLVDPPLKDAKNFVEDLHKLGIRLFMITGDSPITAKSICNQIGLGERIGDLEQIKRSPLDFDGVANVYPQDKFQIVQSFQKTHKITGMTGDGINDAPALKQAEVGIAVHSATDIAKASAKIVLTGPGLQDISKVIAGGRRVYRRMLTWTLTKISRTIEFTLLLTFGYILTKEFLTPLLLIVFIVVLNDLVTIALGSDNAWVSPIPEHWNIREITKIAGVLAIGWSIVAFIILGVCLELLYIPFLKIQTILFVYLIYSAQATIYITRVRDQFWTVKPSKPVLFVTLGDMILVAILALGGIMMEPISGLMLFGTIGVVFLVMLLFDKLKMILFQKSGILGKNQ